MSQENLEIVRAALAAWSEVDSGLADPERLLEFFAPDTSWDMGTFQGWPDQREFRGLDGFLAFRAAWFAAYEEWSYEVENIVEADRNRVVATFNTRGKPRGSDAWADMRYAIVYTVEDGLISRAQAYASPAEALAAAGRSE
jgi:ketosteroid isomerase-like protein